MRCAAALQPSSVADNHETFLNRPMLAERSMLSHLVISRCRGYARRGSNESPP
jgi:hypothetical protein